MSYKYHRCEIDENGNAKADYVAFKIGDDTITFTLTDSEIEMARRNTDSFCNFLDTFLRKLAE